MRTAITRSISLPPEVSQWLDKKAEIYTKKTGYSHGSFSAVVCEILLETMNKKKRPNPQ
jgi:hypothetical protein